MLSRFLKPRYIAPIFAAGTGGLCYQVYGPKVTRFSSGETIARVVENRELTDKEYERLPERVNQKLFWYARSVENDDVTAKLIAYGNPEYYYSELGTLIKKNMVKSVDALLHNCGVTFDRFGGIDHYGINFHPEIVVDGFKEAVRWEKKEILELFLKDENLWKNIPIIPINSAIKIAEEYNDIETIRKLIKIGKVTDEFLIEKYINNRVFTLQDLSMLVRRRWNKEVEHLLSLTMSNKVRDVLLVAVSIHDILTGLQTAIRTKNTEAIDLYVEYNFIIMSVPIDSLIKEAELLKDKVTINKLVNKGNARLDNPELIAKYRKS